MRVRGGLAAAILLFTGLAWGLPLPAEIWGGPGGAAVGKPASNWPTYHGAFFDVRFPPYFRAKSLRPDASTKGFDSVSFLGPGRVAEFFVYCPEVAGDASELSPTVSERLVSVHDSKRPDGTATRQAVVEELHHRYLRQFYLEIYPTEGADVELVQLAFGFKYRDRDALAHFGSDFAAFKASLVRRGN